MPIVKITKKGQITIPIEIRKKLGTNIIEIEEENGKVIIKPVKNLAGALKKYAKKKETLDKILEQEEGAFQNAVKEKYSNR
ncbi:MAG: AbrB/MazE/SpoVT family DNA-binding domain-containing protein [Persephonella sp.]|nr:MAG: AbrB/MazE/SpoVT family DNA-binding domain-containing protein [Persephonella sp.]